MPGAILDIPLSFVYVEDKAVTLYIDYELTGKNGEPLGGTQTKVIQQYVSNKEQTNLKQEDVNMTKEAWASKQVDVTGGGYGLVQYINGAEDISNFGITFSSNKDNAQWVKSASFTAEPNSNLQKVDTATFVHGNNENTDLQSQGSGHLKASEANDYAPWTLNPVSLNPDHTLKSGDWFNAGVFQITWCRNGGLTGSTNYDASGTFTLPTFYYRDIDDLQALWDTCYGAKRADYAKGSEVDALWNTFAAARDAATKLVLAPPDDATFAELYSADNVKNVRTTLSDAYRALSKHYQKESSLHLLTEALATAEPGGDTPEINYQDYVLYEYFQYQDYRTSVRNRIKEYNGPEKPEKYIPDSSLWGDTTVDEFLTSVENEKKKEAITATVIQPTEAENEAYQAALAEWQTPGYTQLDNEDEGDKLVYYKQFLEKKTADKQFLDKEIKYADAQSYSEQAYSKDSWAAYQEAYKNAVAVNSKGDALQSEVFDAKYALMKAENELLAADKSMKDGNTLDNLKALIVKAEDIFQNPANYKVKGETDETEAYKQLIEALGYKTESGEILYDHSALTFVEYDRETTQNNLDRLANAEAKLQAAINNFESNVVADIFPQVDGTEGQDHNGVVDTEHNDGEHKGYLYGITPGEDILEVFGSHGGTLNLVPNAQGVTNGTGAVVQVMQGEQVVAEYVVIIFGDVNGDGKIDDSDTTMSVLESVTAGTLSDAYGFAADVTGDGRADDSDTTLILCASVGTAALSTNPFKET